MSGDRVRRCLAGGFLVLSLLAPAAAFSGAGPTAEHPARKVLKQAPPSYPELARERGLRGAVKIEVVIAKDGTIRSTKPIGGHPLLIQAVEEALKRWKFEPGPETTTVLEFRFGAN